MNREERRGRLTHYKANSWSRETYTMTSHRVWGFWISQGPPAAGGRVQAVGDSFWLGWDTENCRTEVLKQAGAAGDGTPGAQCSVPSTHRRRRARDPTWAWAGFPSERLQARGWEVSLAVHREPNPARDKVRVEEAALKASTCGGTHCHGCLWWQLVWRKTAWFSSGKGDVRPGCGRSRESTLCSVGAQHEQLCVSGLAQHLTWRLENSVWEGQDDQCNSN